ncbi:MAG: LPS export ABC transporter permease LptF [Betaproteobacteria bacterium]|jgi:lipopolysaccharide export system permease protein|nr:LPS export ABC transporter permease LptF [Betaproteobacteria bacterium]MDH5285531.1 LPS export ABC transporter permease LptF [Betaproteobacteria bacterium]
MIFRRSLVRELTLTAVGLFVVLTAILFTNLVLRLLARAAGGTVASEGILALLGFNAVFYLNVLLTVALFLTVLLVMTRWYRDSEMIVWFTAGRSLADWLKPILLFAAPFLAAIVALSLFLSPWAERRKLEFERQLESREEIALLAPGLFREFKRAKLVVFVESVNTFDGTIRNVFLRSTDEAKDETTVARIARLEEAANGDRFLVLEDGRRYEAKPGTLEYRMIEFERLGRRIEPAEARALPASRKAIPTADLFARDGNFERSELFWRLSVPLMALLLTLAAVPLGQVNPRMGRSFNLLAAAFIYMVYSNSLNVVQSLIAQGKVGFWTGLLVPHAAAALVVFLLFRHRMAVAGWRLRRPAPSAA